MEFEKRIKQKLIERGFSEDTILNNRGLIGAVIDETILLTTKGNESNTKEGYIGLPSKLLDAITEREERKERAREMSRIWERL